MLSRTASLGGAVALLALAGTLPAQRTQVTVPSDYTGTHVGPTTLHFGGYGQGRVQQVVRASAINAVACTIQEIRLSPSFINLSTLIGTPAPLPQLDVYLGYSASGPGQLSTTFAQNRKGTQTLLYSGTFARPVDLGFGGFPSTIKLTRPFNYDPRNGDLLIEYVVPQPSPATILWYLDIMDDTEGYGEAEVLLGKGSFSVNEWGTREWSDNTLLRRGGTLNLRVQGFTKPYVSVVAFGTSSTQWGPVPLPLPILTAGMLMLSPDVIVPATWQLRGGNLHELIGELPIPDRPGFEGLEVFAQGICSDPQANALGIVFTNAMKLEIANTTWRQSMVVSSAYNVPTGFLMGGQGYVMQLQGIFP